jgi:immune inhibitor A
MFKQIILKVIVIVLVSMLVGSLTLSAGGIPVAATSGRGLSIVTLQPDALEAIRAQGKNVHLPMVGGINHGKKFNPQGDTIGQLAPDATQKVIVLFAEFTTTPPGGPFDRLDLAYFDDMLFGTSYDPVEYAPYSGYPTDRTLYNYYKEVSYGAIDVVTMDMPSTTGWVDVGHPYEYYSRADGIHDNSFGPFPENAQGLVRDAVLAADAAGVDFAQYAVNGEVPNLFVVYAGTGAEWSTDPSLFWSHSWDLSEGTGMNGMWVDGVKINNYAVMPEVGGDLTGYLGSVTGPFPPTVGVYAHEYGHVLGLPDQYDYGYESDGTDVYSLMAGGSWNRYPAARIFSGNSPAHLDAWSKYRLGWMNPVVIDETSGALTLTLPPAEFDAVSYKMIVPNSDGREYFLFENRQGIGFDQGLIRFGPHGLAIYHVDDTVFTRNYGRPNEAENWKEFRSEGWQKAWTGETHYAISIIQADDRWDLEHAWYAAPSGGYSFTLAGDLYPGLWGVTSFSSNTAPNSSSYYFWGGNDEPKFGFSGVTVTGIQEIGMDVLATFDFVPWKTPRK